MMRVHTHTHTCTCKSRDMNDNDTRARTGMLVINIYESVFTTDGKMLLPHIHRLLNEISACKMHHFKYTICELLSMKSHKSQFASLTYLMASNPRKHFVGEST